MQRLYLLFLFLIINFVVFTNVFAEISHPYVVDEKSQAMFGDSTTIQATSTYTGLENYVSEYVGGYIHFTFTYTHSRFAFASYPPRLYVTDVDPRATSTPTERLNQEIYPLQAIPIPPGHETDWYSYDIQFDATGYTVVVKEAGETEIVNEHRDITGLASTDWVALANLYPNSGNAFSMAFTPLSIQEVVVVPVATTTPVIIVPGIMGSYLNKDDGSEVWINLLKMVLPEDEYLDDLLLSNTGENSLISLNASEIVRSVNVPLFQRDNFKSLISTLESVDLNESDELLTFPYDWRLDIKTTTINLKERIDQIKLQNGVDKVDIVAHSMGGLLVKKYLKDYGGDSIDKFLDIATPHYGSPESLKILSYGNTGITILNKEKVKEISQNMPSVYELLPSREYFDDYPYYVFDGTDGNKRLTYEETKDYLKSEGRNSALVDRADAFHQEIDNLNPADYGVETYNIVGCGTPTLGNFYILESGEHPIYNISFVDGDGTVPLKSAEAMTALKTYYVTDAQHALMPSTSGVKDLIADILTSTSSSSYDISLYSNISNSSGICGIPDGKIVSFHSPIELHIYDSSSNHAGPNADGDIENEIAGLVYEVIGDNKFAFLPDGTVYTVKGEDSSPGTLDIRIQEIINGGVSTTTLFSTLPLTYETTLQFILGPIPSEITIGGKSYPVSTSTAGILESTGKVLVVKENEPEKFKRNQAGRSGDYVFIEATSTPEATSSVVNISIPPPAKGEVLEAEGVREVNSEEISTSTDLEVQLPSEGFDNAALVSKSFGSKIFGLFRSMWGWIISKI